MTGHPSTVKGINSKDSNTKMIQPMKRFHKQLRKQLNKFNKLITNENLILIIALVVGVGYADRSRRCW